MQATLIVIEVPERDWRLDEGTRQVGRRGIAAAREALNKGSRKRAA